MNQIDCATLLPTRKKYLQLWVQIKVYKEAGRQNLTEDKSSCVKESVLVDLLAQQFNQADA